MSCLFPMKRFVIPEDSVGKNGRNYLITSYKCDHIERTARGIWSPVYESGISRLAENWSFDYQEVPCGKCIECRLQHARQWAIRCMLEAQEHTHNQFLTITYDDQHLPASDWCDESTGEVQGTLRLEDLQQFWKSLRQKLTNEAEAKGTDPPNIRYFACGEYGKKTLRPHYHAIVFGLDIPDKILYKVSPRGDKYYVSKWLNSIWKKGYIIIGDVTYESCGYTARYVVKKAEDQSFVDKLNEYGLHEEFVVMSRRPGIGAAWFDKHQDFDRYDIHYLGLDTGSVSFKPPRYFRKLRQARAYAEADSDYFLRDTYRNIDNNLHSEYVKGVVKDATDLTYFEYLDQLEGKKLREIRSLKRDKV